MGGRQGRRAAGMGVADELRAIGRSCGFVRKGQFWQTSLTGPAFQSECNNIDQGDDRQRTGIPMQRVLDRYVASTRSPRG
ncbi:MAG: hypothetical protein JWQ31_3524 [Mycobacterium sp.]|nr:hypothetical protein [Mycobacterium sp.]